MLKLNTRTLAYVAAGFVIGVTVGMFGQAALSEPTLERLAALVGAAGAASILVGVVSIKGLRDALGASNESVGTLVRAREIDRQTMADMEKRHLAEMQELKDAMIQGEAKCMAEVASLKGKLEAYESGAVDALVKAARTTMVNEGVLDERKGTRGKRGS